MNKRFAVGILAVITLTVFYFMALDYVSDENKRHYVGIGIRIHDSAEGVRLGTILKNGPADKAGLKDGDLIVRVDGRPVLSADSLIKRIKNGKDGDSLLFRVFRRTSVDDEKGEEAGRMLYVRAERTAIDKVAWVPMDLVQGTRTSQTGYHFAVQGKVSKDEKTGEFVYWYKVSNLNDKDIYAYWDVFYGERNFLVKWFYGMLFPAYLKAGESKEFVLRSRLAPETAEEPISFSNPEYMYKFHARVFVPKLK